MTTLATKISESYEKFAAFITEMRMEHRDGKLASDRLTELLDFGKIISYTAPKSLISGLECILW